MTKQDWIRKLVSRKFWVCLAGLITGIVSFLKQPTTDAATISSLVMALGSVIAYVVAEGLVDAAHVDDGYYEEPDFEPEEHPPEEAE